MLYQLENGETIDTDRSLSFEERNFIQKMLIMEYLKIGLDEFRSKWRAPGNPVWRGPDTLHNPGPAARILMDLEKKLARAQHG